MTTRRKKFHTAKIVDLHGRHGRARAFTGCALPHLPGIGERDNAIETWKGQISLEDFLARVKERVDKKTPAPVNGSLDAVGSKTFLENRREFPTRPGSR